MNIYVNKNLQEKDIYILIGLKVKGLRESKGMTQLDIASICNYDKTTISRIESGRTNITVKSLFKISRASDVKIKDLIDIE